MCRPPVAWPTRGPAGPMRPGSGTPGFSLTKSLVATVVLQLVAEGRLSLSDTLERWLPAILPYSNTSERLRALL